MAHSVVMLKIFLLLGGFASADGYVTSAGSYSLATKLRHAFPQARVRVLPWGAYPKAAAYIRNHPGGRNVVIGYSGGGSRATWLANMRPHFPLSLAVLYDPSPRWQMKPMPCTVKRTISYTNLHPRFGGLGGGVATGCHVQRIPISMNHVRVQFNSRLHLKTIAAIKGLQ